MLREKYFAKRQVSICQSPLSRKRWFMNYGRSPGLLLSSILPIPSDSGNISKNLIVKLTVAGTAPEFTGFPFNLNNGKP